MERALRLKKAAIEARPKAPGGANAQRARVARLTSGASKPWMKR